jgi:hypothetical protein
VELAEEAERLAGSANPAVLGTLAAAYAEAGRFPEAVAAALSVSIDDLLAASLGSNL